MSFDEVDDRWDLVLWIIWKLIFVAGVVTIGVIQNLAAFFICEVVLTVLFVVITIAGDISRHGYIYQTFYPFTNACIREQEANEKLWQTRQELRELFDDEE